MDYSALSLGSIANTPIVGASRHQLLLPDAGWRIPTRYHKRQSRTVAAVILEAVQTTLRKASRKAFISPLTLRIIEMKVERCKTASQIPRT